MKSTTKQNIWKAVYSKSIISDEILLKQKLSVNQFLYLKELDVLISSFKGDDLSGLISKLKVVEDKAINTLSENEIVYILDVSNLAKHSLTYWNSKKANKWYTYFRNRGNNNIAAKLDYHNVAVTDIAAFAVGFPAGINVGMLVGGLTAGIASGGITAGLGAVLGGFAGGTVSGLASAASASAIILGAEMAANWFGW
jgi:hypothetical protein